MKTTEALTAATAAVDNLRERVIRLGEENDVALANVTATAEAVTKALVDGKAAPEKAHELALEESDRASRRLEAAKDALERAEKIAAKAAVENEAALEAAALETANILAKQIRPDLRRAALLLGAAVRAEVENDARSWQARKALQALGGDGPIESFPIPGLAWESFLDEVAGELSAKRDGKSCDRIVLRLPY